MRPVTVSCMKRYVPKLATISKNTYASLEAHSWRGKSSGDLTVCRGKSTSDKAHYNHKWGWDRMQWLTINKIQPNCFFRVNPLCEINSLSPVGESMHTTMQYSLKRNTFAQESRVMPRVLGRWEEGKACNMILAMHGTLLQRISSDR